MNYAEDSPRAETRAKSTLDRVETFYLKVLRAVILLLATLLLAYAGWLATMSLYKMSRSVDSVVVENASVAAAELIDAELPAPANRTRSQDGSRAPSEKAAERAYYTGFINRYYALYQSKFEPFRQLQDKVLTKSEFDGAFIESSRRLAAINEGELVFSEDRTDLEALLAIMTEASVMETTVARLQRYKSARKVPVTKRVERTRVTYEAGWDSSSMTCANWYETPYGCPVRRPVESVYTEAVTTMEFPKGTQSHTQIFKAFQDRYFGLLQDRREANVQRADQERESIVSGNLSGQLSLMTALQLLGGFLALMFFFLLIAIERHQRRIAAESEGTGTPALAQ